MIHNPRFLFTPAAGLAAALLLFAGVASADVKIYDTTLASPDTTAANITNNLSWYNGSGNQGVQGGWTVDQNNGIELGLRAKYRQAPQVIDSPTDDYYVLPGFQGVTARAKWNYEFSINLRPDGVGTLTLADITALLTITDVNTGATATVNPFSYWTDNSGYGVVHPGPVGGAAGITSTGRDNAAVAADWSFQNSENATFPDFPLGNALVCTTCEVFDPYAAHTYAFDLKVTLNSNGSTLAENHMDVIVTPEPSALILFGTAAFAALLIRRRRSKAVA